MNLELITSPIIGGVIGFITNGIALKMLFRPFKPIYIFKKIKVPFTPGLIPKEQHRIAKAIGKVVGNDLLDKGTFLNALLSEEIHLKIDIAIDEFISKLYEKTETVSEFLLDHDLLDKFDENKDVIKINASNYVTEKLIEIDIASILIDYASDEIIKNINPMFSPIATKAFNSARPSLIKKINNLIQEKSPSTISDFIDKEYLSIKNKQINEIAKLITTKFPDYKAKLWVYYQKLINKYLEKILKGLNISSIIEQKINELEMSEMENLIMSITKKELNALIYLGGVLGTLIGFLNVLF
jgi:uncharacterized membrane protein YheB (UPF0754 family)